MDTGYAMEELWKQTKLKKPVTECPYRCDPIDIKHTELTKTWRQEVIAGSMGVGEWQGDCYWVIAFLFADDDIVLGGCDDCPTLKVY